MVIDDTGPVEGTHAFIYCKKWRFGQVLPMPHSQCKDRATQLLTKYKSGALVTQSLVHELKLFKSSFQHLSECSLSKPVLVERHIA